MYYSISLSHIYATFGITLHRAPIVLAVPEEDWHAVRVANPEERKRQVQLLSLRAFAQKAEF
jgi:hypothetical protein